MGSRPGDRACVRALEAEAVSVALASAKPPASTCGSAARRALNFGFGPVVRWRYDLGRRARVRGVDIVRVRISQLAEGLAYVKG